MKWLQSLLQDSAGGTVSASDTEDVSQIPADPALRAESTDSAATTLPISNETAGPRSSVTGGTGVAVNGTGAVVANVPAGLPAPEAAAIIPATEYCAAPPVYSAAGIQEDLAGQLAAIAASQRELNDVFQSRLRSDEAQSRAVEKLADELRQYKANFVRQQQMPLLKEVIFCQDLLVQELERQQRTESNREGAIRALEVARQMLVDILFKYDVEPFRVASDQFDPKLQQCTRTIPTESAAEDKQIASRGLEGFQSADGIVRREQVTVYKFTPGD